MVKTLLKCKFLFSCLCDMLFISFQQDDKVDDSGPAACPSQSPSLSSPHPRSPPEEQPPGHKGKSKESPVRRRAPRALTGKHVRPGTGASPSTLRTLRQKLEERRRLRHEGLPGASLARWPPHHASARKE